MERNDISMINIQLNVLACLPLDCDKKHSDQMIFRRGRVFGALFSFGLVFMVFHLQVTEQELK